MYIRLIPRLTFVFSVGTETSDKTGFYVPLRSSRQCVGWRDSSSKLLILRCIKTSQGWWLQLTGSCWPFICSILACSAMAISEMCCGAKVQNKSQSRTNPFNSVEMSHRVFFVSQYIHLDFLFIFVSFFNKVPVPINSKYLYLFRLRNKWNKLNPVFQYL